MNTIPMYIRPEMIVSIGDLVKINDVDNDARGVGVVLKFDMFTAKLFDGLPESIVEVLWADGMPGWILEKRLDVLAPGCKSR